MCALVVLADLTIRPVMPVALAALVGSALLARLRPEQAWAAALMVGLSIPMGHLALHSFEAPDPRPDAPPFSSLLALIPAAAGAIIAARLRKRAA